MFHFGPGPKQKDYNTDTDLIRSEIGIIVDGNKSALGASTGQYVILKNSTITGKTDGLYKAAQAIPANTAIDGSYLTAVSGGLGAEVASANSSISTLNGNIKQMVAHTVSVTTDSAGTAYLGIASSTPIFGVSTDGSPVSAFVYSNKWYIMHYSVSGGNVVPVANVTKTITYYTFE